MTAKLSNRSSKDVADLLTSFGFHRTSSGPHEHWTRPGHPGPVIVPSRRGHIPPGTLLSILRQAGIPKDKARAFWDRTPPK